MGRCAALLFRFIPLDSDRALHVTSLGVGYSWYKIVTVLAINNSDLLSSGKPYNNSVIISNHGPVCLILLVPSVIIIDYYNKKHMYYKFSITF